MRAAVSRLSPNAVFHWLNSRLAVIIRLFLSQQLEITWKSSSVASLWSGTKPISSMIYKFCFLQSARERVKRSLIISL